jgi:hypothetical protein
LTPFPVLAERPGHRTVTSGEFGHHQALRHPIDTVTAVRLGCGRRSAPRPGTFADQVPTRKYPVARQWHHARSIWGAAPSAQTGVPSTAKPVARRHCPQAWCQRTGADCWAVACARCPQSRLRMQWRRYGANPPRSLPHSHTLANFSSHCFY